MSASPGVLDEYAIVWMFMQLLSHGRRRWTP